MHNFESWVLLQIWGLNILNLLPQWILSVKYRYFSIFELFTQATYFNNEFMQMTDIDKFIFLFREEVCQNLPFYNVHLMWATNNMC